MSMQVVNTGSKYEIYDNSISTYYFLPPAIYRVHFDPREGYSLIRQEDNFTLSEKVYGAHPDKINKVFTAYQKFNRNLGVLLSGDKGIGKSLFTKMLAIKMVENGIPLILVNKHTPNLSEFINGIKQEVMVLFDEFEKTFSKTDEQTELLSLFDGLSVGKKLFVVTCNSLSNLSEFYVDRPGRFHYHFQFTYPTAADIKEYLVDHCPHLDGKEISETIKLSHRCKLNYDALRAIAFEFNMGRPLKIAVNDLNIGGSDLDTCYIIAKLKDGTQRTARHRLATVFSNECIDEGIEFTVKTIVNKEPYWLTLSVPIDALLFDEDTGRFYYPADKVTPIKNEWEDEEDEEFKLACEYYKRNPVTSIVVEMHKKKDGLFSRAI